MEARAVKAVIFDLDGTLVDSAPDIHAAANFVLRAEGVPPIPIATLRSFVGNGIPKLVERVMRARDIAFTESRHIDLTAAFTRRYAEYPVEESRLYAGVRKALAALQQQGFALGVCTNKNHAISVQILEGLGIDQFFDAVIGGDSLAVRKPDPAPLRACADALAAKQVVFVGDSEVDASTAKATGYPFALFTEGYRKSPVRAIPHDVAFAGFDGLGPVIHTLFQSADRGAGPQPE